MTTLFVSYYSIHTEKMVMDNTRENLLVEKDNGEIVRTYTNSLSEAVYTYYSLLFQHILGKDRKIVSKSKTKSAKMFIKALVTTICILAFILIFTIIALVY